AVLDQATNDLLEEERVAARALNDPSGQLLGERGVNEQGTDQRLARWTLQGREPNRYVVDAAGCECTRLEGGSRGQHDNQPAAVEPVGEQAKRLERGCICPMQILDHEKDWSTRQSPLEERTHREVDLTLELFGFYLARAGLNRAKTDNMVERGHELSALS